MSWTNTAAAAFRAARMLGSATAALTLLWAGAAQAVVSRASEAGFTLTYAVAAPATPEAAYRALARIDRWWSPAHTYSGDAGALSLRPAAGGCFCERWPGGAVEHARVVAAVPGQTLRLAGAFGPLQQMGVSAALTFAIEETPDGARITADYEVVGRPDQDLAALAPIVDRVLAEQMGRLERYLQTGRAG